jgi:hypothetical protein
MNQNSENEICIGCGCNIEELGEICGALFADINNLTMDLCPRSNISGIGDDRKPPDCE